MTTLGDSRIPRTWRVGCDRYSTSEWLALKTRHSRTQLNPDRKLRRPQFDTKSISQCSSVLVTSALFVFIADIEYATMTKFSFLSRHVLLAVHVISFLHLSFAISGSVCSTGIYKDLLFLSDYAPAKSYCSIHYPVLPTSVTITAGAVKKGYQRRNLQQTTTASKPAAGVYAKWSSLLSSAPAIVSTVCSCIEKPSTKTASTELQNLLSSV